MEPKKRSLGAAEGDEFLRGAWREPVGRTLDGDRFVFVDECGTDTAMAPPYAWSRTGERAFGLAPSNWGSNVTLLASITREGMGPCVAVEGPTTGAMFEAYLERALAPVLEPGRVVVMDNLSAHKGARVRGIVESRGCELLFLPPYSPDFNPIEQAFSKLKASLRRAQARTYEALIGAMGRALDEITERDASGFFRHCGYRAPVQLP